MFKQIFETVAVPYRTPEDWAGIPNGIGLQSLYNGYLVTPPRIYAEELYFEFGLFCNRETTATSESTITLAATTSRIYWPGYGYMLWTFDGITGAFISRETIGGDITSGVLYITSLTQSFDGNIWAAYNIGEIREFAPGSFDLLQTFTDDHFGRNGCSLPLADKARDIVIMPVVSGHAITVYTLSTGAAVRTIALSGTPIQICAEDDRRVYVLCDNYSLHLVDYTTGDVIGSCRCPIPPSATFVVLAWDRILRRLLVFARVPDAVDGACESVVRGYYPVPVPTYLTAPIPLKPPRKGRTIPVLLRTVGDIGEPLAGAQVTVEATGDATIVRAPRGTDSNGETVFELLCSSAGSVDVDASMENGL
jgi:hypothetical protein